MDDIDILVTQFGGEGQLAERIKTERLARNWSQDQLAKELAKAGVDIAQTGISKIETPQPGGRRAIMVDELIGFAKVFNLPVRELLVAESAVRNAQAWQLLKDGYQELQLVQQAQDRYKTVTNELAIAALDMPELEAELLKQREQEEQRANRRVRQTGRARRPRPSFTEDVLTRIGVLRDQRKRLGKQHERKRR